MSYAGSLPFDTTAEPQPVVLIAEDDSSSAQMLESLLRRVGYQVIIAQTGHAALQAVHENPAPDVVVLDWMLPEISGLEVCRRLREEFDPLQLPILMVTAKADAESVSGAFQAGASDYITKPFLGAELRARIAAHLRIKRLSDAKREMDEHLMEREKLSTLGLLVSGVAHELNNPLGGIYGYTQLLLEDEADPEKLVALERIASEVQRCNRIAGELLSFSRRHAPERASVDVAEVLSQTLSMRDRQLQRQGILPRLCLNPGLPEIVGDAHQLQQVFLNVIVNAEHALRSSGTTLRVTVERASERELAEGDWLAVRIFNDGPPIPPVVIGKIFEPFYTTKGKEEGTGLGLAICRRIVREHGGDILVDSHDEGTSFAIYLPVDPARLPQRDPPN